MKSLSRSRRPFDELSTGICASFQATFLLLVAASLVFNGCATFERATQTRTLSENGFLARVPETQRQHDAYAALPPYVLYRGTTGGQAVYAYKEPKAGVVYIGNEEDYQRYMRQVRRLVAFYETTEQKMVAQEMDNDLQRRLAGSWSDAGAERPRD